MLKIYAVALTILTVLVGCAPRHTKTSLCPKGERAEYAASGWDAHGTLTVLYDCERGSE